MFLWFVSYVFVICFFVGLILFLSKQTLVETNKVQLFVTTKTFLQKNIEILTEHANETHIRKLAKVLDEREANAEARTKRLG